MRYNMEINYSQRYMALLQLWHMITKLPCKRTVTDGAFDITKELALTGSDKNDLENDNNYNSSEIKDKSNKTSK